MGEAFIPSVEVYFAQEADMQALSQEVRKFISACEDIQSLLAQGGNLTSDEKGVIEQSAIDLLANVKLEIRDKQRSPRPASCAG